MKRRIPEELLQLIANKFRMLSDPTRLVILRILMERAESNVTVIVGESGQSMANVSKHLKLLAQSGIVSRRKDGANVFYKLDDPVVEQICQLVCGSILRQLEKEHQQQRMLLRVSKRSPSA